jgi:hypothetical protein
MDLVFGEAARFLGKETYGNPSDKERSTNPLGGNYRAIGEPAIGAGKPSGKGSLQRKLIWIQPSKTAGLAV